MIRCTPILPLLVCLVEVLKANSDGRPTAPAAGMLESPMCKFGQTLDDQGFHAHTIDLTHH